MIGSIVTSVLVASVILVPKSGKEIRKGPAPTPPQELIFEDNYQSQKDRDIEPEVVLKKAQKKKHAKNKKNRSKIADETDDGVTDILKQEKDWFRKDGKVKVRRDKASVKTPLEKFLRIEEKYKTTSHFMYVSKEVTQALLEKTKLSKGELYIAPKGKIRLEIKDPERSLFIMDGKNIWVVDYPVDGMQNKVQILQGKIDKSLKSQVFLGFLFGSNKIIDEFKLEDSKANDAQTTYIFKPKKKEQDVQKAEIQVDTDKELITSISYWDGLGNKTSLLFSKQTSKDIPDEKFKFTPPANAEITNL